MMLRSAPRDPALRARFAAICDARHVATVKDAVQLLVRECASRGAPCSSHDVLVVLAPRAPPVWVGDNSMMQFVSFVAFEETLAVLAPAASPSPAPVVLAPDGAPPPPLPPAAHVDVSPAVSVALPPFDASALSMGGTSVPRLAVWLVMRFLEPRDLLRVALVCRCTAMVARDDALWAPFVESPVWAAMRALQRGGRTDVMLAPTGTARRQWLRMRKHPLRRLAF